jgi:hypothetical protein
MPNWCCNGMCIKGDKKEIESFLKKIQTDPEGDTDADFVKALDRKGSEYGVNTYLFNLVEPDWVDARGSYYVQFDTRWSPLGDQIMEDVSLKYPDLEFIVEYEESGNAFMGYDSIKAGKWVEREYYEGEQYIDSRTAVDEVLHMSQDEIIKDLGELRERFDPANENAEYYCPTAFAILLARLAGDEITKENFPQVFMKEI